MKRLDLSGICSLVIWVLCSHFVVGCTDDDTSPILPGVALYGDRYLETGRALIMTEDNGFVVVGSGFPAMNQGFVMKVDRHGFMEWNVETDDELCDIVETGDQALVLLGSTSISKRSMNGELIWMKSSSPGVNRDYFSSFARTEDNGFIITGAYWVDYGQSRSLLLLKVDENGDEVWRFVHGDENSSSMGYDVIAVQDGYVATGLMYDSGYSRHVATLLKTDLEGTVAWSRTFDMGYMGKGLRETADQGFMIIGEPPAPDRGVLIRTDPQGQYLWSKTFDQDYENLIPMTGGYLLVGTSGSHNYNGEIGLTRVDEQGTQVWSRHYNVTESHTDGEIAYDVVAGSAGEYVLTGVVGAIFTGSTYYGDIFLMKIDQNGSIIPL